MHAAGNLSAALSVPGLVAWLCLVGVGGWDAPSCIFLTGSESPRTSCFGVPVYHICVECFLNCWHSSCVRSLAPTGWVLRRSEQKPAQKPQGLKLAKTQMRKRHTDVPTPIFTHYKHTQVLTHNHTTPQKMDLTDQKQQNAKLNELVAIQAIYGDAMTNVSTLGVGCGLLLLLGAADATADATAGQADSSPPMHTHYSAGVTPRAAGSSARPVCWTC